MVRAIAIEERFFGKSTTLRLVRLEDCGPRYLAWLNDDAVNQYLETRWAEQSLESIRAFITSTSASDDSYLFAIESKLSGSHVGNIKIGPIHTRHQFADISYFIGERGEWGKGLASDAIAVVVRVAFERLGVHRVQAGVYEGNVASSRALQKAGFRREGCLRKQLRTGDVWEDHIWYGLLREEWTP